jgi:hypothetical protein
VNLAVRYTGISSTNGSSSGLFRWIAGGISSYSQVAALDAPLPGVSLPATLPDNVEPGKTKITTLPNGVKIASETSPVRLFFFLGRIVCKACFTVSGLFYPVNCVKRRC